MNDAILIQVGVGTSADMLTLTGERHAAWCAAHGFDFWSGDGAGLYDNMAPKWRRYAALLDGLREHDYAVALDADCIIVDPSADLRDALLPDASFGLARGKVPGAEPEHWNSGAIYVRKTPAVSRLLAAMVKLAPDRDDFAGYWWENPHGDQRTLNALLGKQFSGMAYTVDKRWNQLYAFHEEAGAAVLAYHILRPAEAKLAAMREWLERGA